jgi:hypothetical protein
MKFQCGPWNEWSHFKKWNATGHSPSWIHYHTLFFINYLNFRDFQLIPNDIKFSPHLLVNVHPQTILLIAHVTPQSACNINITCTPYHIHRSHAPKGSLYSTYIIHMQAKPSYTPAMYELANWTGINHIQCIHLSDATDYFFWPTIHYSYSQKNIVWPTANSIIDNCTYVSHSQQLLSLIQTLVHLHDLPDLIGTCGLDCSPSQPA